MQDNKSQPFILAHSVKAQMSFCHGALSVVRPSTIVKIAIETLINTKPVVITVLFFSHNINFVRKIHQCPQMTHLTKLAKLFMNAICGDMRESGHLQKDSPRNSGI